MSDNCNLIFLCLGLVFKAVIFSENPEMLGILFEWATGVRAAEIEAIFPLLLIFGMYVPLRCENESSVVLV